jgi:outer membrane receptor protein involved in Fe transport
MVASILNITNKKYTDVGIYKASYTSPYNLTVYPNPGRSFSLTGRYAF